MSNQKPSYLEEQTIQWHKERGQKMVDKIMHACRILKIEQQELN